ncbi:MAG: hypothetical protein P4L33_02575 [Capsulimonadaceae bacterium]|nr:hypothetical protein [Capsulimonadaceae bacterium]
MSDSISDLKRMTKEAESLYINYTNLSDFCIWHAECRGRLRNILKNQPKALTAWETLETESSLNWDEDAFIYTDSSIATYYEHNVDEKIDRDMSERLGYGSRVQEARRILLEYISLVTAGSDGAVEPASIPERLDLDFIDNRDLRQVCKRLYREAYSCMQAKSYVACTILLGSLLEGILSAVVQVYHDDAINAKAAQRRQNDAIEAWDLVTLINVAKELGWITQDTKELAHRLRSFRNSVHPNELVKASPNLDKASTKLLIDTVVICIRDLNNWLKKPPTSE